MCFLSEGLYLYDMASLCRLPKEVVEEIMLWVPTDSLVQFKCVNKYWYSLISALLNDPAFVAKHLLITKTKSSPSLLFNSRSPGGVDGRQLITFPLVTIFNDDGNRDHFTSVTEALILPVPKQGWWMKFYHCDGIICLVRSDGTIMLCNPALQESRILPQSKNSIIGEAPFTTGFGYDSRASDYKFVSIWYISDGLAKAEVYTLGGSDSWREINMPQDLSDCIEGARLKGLCWKGVCYWLVHNPDGYENDFVLCFNMCEEEFYLIQLPDLEDFTLGIFGWSLSVWNDSVTLYLTSQGDDSREYHFFMMDDGGTKGDCSWTKCVFFKLGVDVMDELAVWKNDEFLMEVMKNKGRQLVSYNLGTHKFTDVVVGDTDGIGLPKWACFYVKSLVSVRRR